MIHVLLRLRVEDYNKFKNAFEDTLEWRREHDSTDLTLLFGWDEIGVARDVFASAEWSRMMDEAGVEGSAEPTFLQLLDRGSA